MKSCSERCSASLSRVHPAAFRQSDRALTRRRLILVLGLGALSPVFPAFTQQERRTRRIGFFSAANLQVNVSRLAAFREGMAELRWVEGRDYDIDARYADGVSETTAGIAAALVASKPDLLLASADGSIGPLAQRTKTIPRTRPRA